MYLEKLFTTDFEIWRKAQNPADADIDFLIAIKQKKCSKNFTATT
jgi:hypothetical protein